MADTFLLADLVSQAGQYVMHIPKCCVACLHIAILVLIFLQHDWRNQTKPQKNKKIQYVSLEAEVSNTPNVGGFNMLVSIICSESRAVYMLQLSNC